MKALVGITLLAVSFPFVVIGFLVAIPVKALVGGFGKVYEDFTAWLSQ